MSDIGEAFFQKATADGRVQTEVRPEPRQVERRLPSGQPLRDPARQRPAAYATTPDSAPEAVAPAHQMAAIWAGPMDQCDEMQRYGRVALVQWRPYLQGDPVSCIPLVPLSVDALGAFRAMLNAQAEFESARGPHRTQTGAQALYAAVVRSLPAIIDDVRSKLTTAEVDALRSWWMDYSARPVQVDRVININSSGIVFTAVSSNLILLALAYLFRHLGVAVMVPIYLGIALIIDVQCAYYLWWRRRFISELPRLPGGDA